MADTAHPGPGSAWSGTATDGGEKALWDFLEWLATRHWIVSWNGVRFESLTPCCHADSGGEVLLLLPCCRLSVFLAHASRWRQSPATA